MTWVNLADAPVNVSGHLWSEQLGRTDIIGVVVEHQDGDRSGTSPSALGIEFTQWHPLPPAPRHPPSPIARLSRELGDSGTKEILPPTERNLTMLSEGKLEELKPCPFCGARLLIRKGANPSGRCATEGCWMERRAVTVPLDDPRQVSAWNTRAQAPAPVAAAEAFRALISNLRALRAERDKATAEAAANWQEYLDERSARMAANNREHALETRAQLAEKRALACGSEWQRAAAELAALRAQAPAPVRGEVVEAAADLVNGFAWSCVRTDCDESRVYLQSLINRVRAALSPDPTEGGTDE